MKKIYMLNNSQGVIGLLLGLKSRITLTRPLLTMLALLMVCLFGVNEKAWGTTGNMNYTVYLQQGKGKVQAEVWKYVVKGSGKNDYACDVQSTSTPKGSATASKNDGDTKYWKFRVPDDGQNAGYTFIGWYSDDACEDQLSTDKTYGSRTLTAARTKKVYAKFQANTYTVTFAKNASDATLGTTSSKVTYDATYGAGTGGWPTPTRTGYTFNGWFTDASNGEEVTSGTTVAITDAQTLYAHWTAIGYSVTLDNETPTTSGSTSVTLTFDSNDHDPITNPKKDDYTFGGWYSEDNGEGELIIDVNGNLQANKTGYTGANGIWRRTTTPTTLYAKWILNSKTITLDNQSATTAGTKNITVFYNRNDNLTGTPAITVPTKTGYTFEGYYTETAGGGVQIIAKNGNVNASVAGYTDANKKWIYDGDKTLYAYWKQNQTITWNQTIGDKIRSNTVTLSATASSGLTVTYSASPSDLVSISGNVVTCLKAGTVYITANQTGNKSYNASSNTPKKSFTIAEHAITKNPTATSIIYEQKLSSSTLSGGTANVDGTWSWKYPNSEPAAGTANQVAVFTPSSSVISAYPLECNVSVTVNKATPDVTCSIADTYEVDDAALDLQTLWTREGNGTITYSKVSFTSTGSNNGKATTPAITNNRYLSLGQAGNLRIQMAIAEGSNYNQRTVTKDITINKRENTLYANGSTTYHPVMYMGKELAVTLTATNVDYTNSPIQLVAQTVGDNTVAVFDYTQGTHSGTVRSKYKKDVTATWSIHQDENYKYLEANNTFSVDVTTAAEANCYVLEATDEKSYGKYGDASNTQWQEFSWTGTPDKLKFKMWKYSDANDIGNHVYVYDASGNQLEEFKYTIGSMNTTQTDYTEQLPEDARKIRIQNGGGTWATASTFSTYVSSIYVTRKIWLNASDQTIDKTSTNNPVYPSDGTGVGQLVIDYSLASGGDLKIYNDNDKFTLSQTTISNVDCKEGSATINIQYQSNTAGTDYAHLVIYNDVYRKEVTITGITSKRNQTITWNVGNAIQVLSEIENAASVSANTEITYSTNNSAVIAIENGKLVAKGVGEATITVNAPGDDEYNAVEGSKTITVTSDLVQHIVWNQSLLGLHTDDADKTLNAYATSDVDGCTTNGGRAITYSSSDESVVKIVNGIKLRVIGKGTAYVTASQAGGLDDDGHTYMAVIEERKAIVRDPSDPCEAYVYQQTGTATMDLGWNWLSQQDRDTEIALSAEPDQMTFRYKFEKKSDLVGVKYGGGTMYVEQKIGNNDWTKVGDDLTPSEGSYQTATVNLDRHATKVRIRAHGVGYHSFTDCQISMLRYIETSELATFEAKVGQEAAQNMTLSYSNITGPVTLILGHTPSNFSVSQTAIEGSCGDHNSVNITVTYTPIAATEEETELLRISDGVTTHDISLTGVATVTNRYISWDIPSPNSVYTVETVNLSAQALTSVGNSPAGSVFYTKGELSTTGNLSGSTLTFSNDGVAYIAAQGVADPKYNATDIVTKTFNVSKTPTSISVAPTVETIVSGTAANAVVLNTASAVSGYDVNGFSGTVEGTWSVIEEDLNTVGENRSIKIHFEPSNTDMFIGCDGYINNVTVSQREATEEEVIGVASAITYGQTAAEASTLSNDGTLAGTWEWIDERADDVLAVYTYTDMQARFTPNNGNIQPKVVNVSLTVNKANPVATVNAVEITYGATASSVDLEGTGVAGAWSWKDSRKDDVLAAGEYTMTVHFVPTDAANYNEKDATVTLTVNKAPSVATPSAAAITAGQKVSESALTNSGTEGTWVWDDAVKNTTPAAGTYNYTVHFTPENDNYTTLTTTVSLKVNALVNEFTNAAGDGDWSNDSNWSSGSKPDGTENPDVIVSGQLIIDEDVTVGNLTIEPEGGVTVVTNGTLTINGSSNDQSGYGDLYVKNGGEVNVVGSLKVGDLVVEASIGTSSGNAKSGQVAHAEHIVYTNAYIDINMDPSGEMDDTKWYGFTVPFAVNAHNGVSRLEGSTISQCVYGSDYLIAEYDAIKRLNSGNGWKFISGNTLNAGQFYFLTVDGSYNTYRFKASGSTYAPADDASLSINGDVTNYNANWNGVGNSTLQHVTASYAGGEYVQVYMNGKDAYKTVSTNDATFVVGCPFFVQAKEETTLSLSEQNSSTEKYYAPRRIQDKATGVARISLSATDGGYSDQIYFSAVDKEQDAYIIGQDLAKAGESTVVPQLWMAQYNQKLSVHEAALNRDRAACSLGIYTPKAGLYEIAVERAPEDATLYLTYNGRAIWNLSMSAYEFDLEKGTTEGYGLRIVASQQTTTDIENGGLLNEENGVRKVLIDNVIYIVTPEGKMYDIVGKGIKF